MLAPNDVLPVAAAGVWSSVAAFLVARRRSNASERALALSAVLIAASAVAEWAFLHAPDPGTALASARVRLTLVSVASLALLWFGLWLARSPGRADALAAIPVVAAVALTWTTALQGVRLGTTGPVLLPAPGWYGATLSQPAAYAALCLSCVGWTLWRGTFPSLESRRRLAVLWAGLVGGLAAWTIVNVAARLAPGVALPTPSLFLLLMGLPILLGTTLHLGRLRAAVRRLALIPGRPTAAILYHASGQPIAEVVAPGAERVDPEVLRDLARAVDGFLARETGARGNLRQIEHGDRLILFESGRHLTLAVVVKGRPPAGLRSEMRAAIGDVESAAGDELGAWEGAASFSERALEALESLLGPTLL